jgi:hypothetical protein
MLNKRQIAKLKKLIREYGNARVAESWKGRHPVEDHEELEEDLEDAKSAIDIFLLGVSERLDK